MICAKHQKPYQVSCPACDLEARQKDEKLEQEVDRLNKKAQKKGEPPIKKPSQWQWQENPLYDGPRDYTQEFRGKVLSALQLISSFPYGKQVDGNKFSALYQTIRLRRLDDVFQVAKSETDWSAVVKALGGSHGEEVFHEGQWKTTVALGCTTYSRVSSNGQGAQKDDVLSMQGTLNDSKVIYLRNKQIDTSTIVHELLHYFCHKDFYKAFSAPGVGAEWKKVNEGITEYFARKACKSHHKAYQNEVDFVMDLMANTNFREDQMADAYFEGNIAELNRIIAAGEYKREALASGSGMDKVLELAGRRKDRKKF